VRIYKAVVPPADGGRFNLLVDGEAKETDVGDGGDTGAVGASVGSHTLSEEAYTGTSLDNYTTTYSCTDEQSGTGTSVEVDVAKNETVACTFTNTRNEGTLIVNKVIVDAHEGAKECPDFSLVLSPPGGMPIPFEADCSNEFSLAAGDTYTVTEPPVANYATTYDNCTDVLIPSNETVTCTITNTLLTGSIVIAKAVLPPNATVDFDFVSNTEPITFTLGDQDDQLFADLPPDVTYAFTETVPDGWSLAGVTCTGDEASAIITDTVPAVSIWLAPEENITCTFMNMALPSIEVVKTVKPTTVKEPCGPVTYKVQVTNSNLAASPLTLTELWDDLYGDVISTTNPLIFDTTCELVAIEPGETYECTFGAIVEGEAGDLISDTVEAIAHDDYDNIVSAQDDALVTITPDIPDTGGAFPAPLLLGSLAAVGAAMLTAARWVRRQVR
jgi:hypothetical protein